MPSGLLEANPPTSTIHLTSRISSWLYTVFAIMAISTFVMAFAIRKRARGTRVFHQLATVVLAIAAIDYFTMASNLGNTPVSTTMRQQGTRAIWYTRYIDWTITTSLLLLTLLLATGLPLGDIMLILFFDLIMIVCGLVGALIESDYKWSFFVFGLLSLFYIVYHVLVPARASARLMGLDWGRAYARGAGLLLFVWMLYPICWALSEGGNVMGTTGEMIFYSILDIISKPIYLFMHINALNKLNYGDLALSSGKYSDPINSGVAHHHPIGNTGGTHMSQTGATAAETHGGGFGKRGFGLFGRKEKHEEHDEAAYGAGDVALQQQQHEHEHELSPVGTNAAPLSPPTAYARGNAAI